MRPSVSRHLCYLSAELIALALFDKPLPDFEKRNIAEKLVTIPRSAEFHKGMPDFDSVADLIGDEKPFLAAFVTEQSWLVFHLQIQIQYLHWLTLPLS